MLQRHFTPVLRAACGIALGAAVAQAQTIPPGCQAPIAARKKLFITPHHTYTTETAGSAGAPARTREGISTADATYIQLKSGWKKSPLTPQDMLKQLDENILDAKSMSCRQLGDEAVDGTSASVYTAHSQTSEATSDAKMWIAKGTGLVLKEEEDLSDGTDKRHMSIRYDYKNVRAPAGIQ